MDHLVVPRAGFIANHGVLLKDHDFPPPECQGPSNGQSNYAGADHDAFDFVQKNLLFHLILERHTHRPVDVEGVDDDDLLF